MSDHQPRSVKDLLSKLHRGLFALAVVVWPLSASAQDSNFVGSADCQQCHAAVYEQWQQSHHHDAMLSANESSVLGDFDDATFTHFDVTTKFFRRDGDFFVSTQNAEGKAADFRVAYTFGVDPLQQYLIEFPDGRMQALNVAWDSRPIEEGGQRWFHLHPDEPVPAGDVLHWTGHFYNWNLRCAECHSTQLEKNYSLAENRYDTSWQEINVGCEACHGPARQHLAWAQDADSGVPNKGFEQDIANHNQWLPSATTARRAESSMQSSQLDICAPCHSRRSIVSTPKIGDRFHDTYRLANLAPDLYHPDGQILDEVYVFGSFLQSKMYQQGVVCSDCHNPHSARVYADDNSLCARCHNPERYDSRDHHHHAPGSMGAQCVECHMPETTYMVVDPRRDHSIRIPNPAVTERFGAPNACSSCHSDRDLEWVVASFSKRHGAVEPPAHAHAFHAITQGAQAGGAMLADLALDGELPVIIRSTAVEMLEMADASDGIPVGRQLTKSDEPQLRAAAARLLVSLPPLERIELLSPLLEDRYASVRSEAARLIAAIPENQLPGAEAERVARAQRIYLESMAYNMDAPGTHLNLGAGHVARQNLDAAEQAYRQALLIDASFLPALLNLADLYRAKGEDWRARPLLSRALRIEPTYADAHYAMGLLLIRQQRYQQAMPYLEEAARLRPEDGRYVYVYAVALDNIGQRGQARAALEAGIRHRRDDTSLLTLLAQYQIADGELAAARQTVEKALAIAPGDPQLNQLAGRLGLVR